MKLKILIILGVLLLVGVSCRDGHDGPLQKEAYGLAVYSPDEKTLTIQDELDTTEVRKTYPTDYASFGFGDEKVDLTQKVYVYFYGNSLEMVVSHLDIDRAPNYQLLAYRLGLRHFWHSLWPYLMPVAVVLLCLGYYCRYRYVLRRLDVKKGLNLVRQAHLLFWRCLLSVGLISPGSERAIILLRRRWQMFKPMKRFAVLTTMAK